MKLFWVCGWIWFLAGACTPEPVVAHSPEAPIKKRVPHIRVTAPSARGMFGEDAVDIAWEERNLPKEARIVLSYHAQNGCQDGTVIADATSEASHQNRFRWKLEGVPEGDYYICATLREGPGHGQAVRTSVSEGVVRVVPAEGTRGVTFEILSPNGPTTSMPWPTRGIPLS